MEEYQNIIIEKLQQLNIDYESLKPFMKDYINRIEVLIQAKKQERFSAMKAIKDSRFTVSSISEVLGCSRTTLYNHNALLKKYIELSIDLFDAEDPYIKYEKLRASIDMLENKVNKMVLRDIDTELLREENNELKKMLNEKLDDIRRLQIRNAELSKELLEIRKKQNESTNSSANVIKLEK